MAAFKEYYELAKPERTLANIITALAGFLLASKWHINFSLLVATLGGMALVIASACVANNFIDRGIDAKMDRTRRRVLVRGRLPAAAVIIYAVVLGSCGFLTLGLFVNALVMVLGAVAYIDYVALYGWSKRRSVHSTLIGTVSGSMSLVAGYCAVTGRLDAAAVILFFIMVFWQMPHFYAIGIYRLKDYKAAALPIWPAQKGVASTKRWILVYMLAFAISTVLLTVFDYTHYIYLTFMLLIGGYWLWLAAQGLKTKNNEKWARQVFLFSLVVIMALSAAIALGGILP
jgi:protoheme IX farnesyltransferase